jgi:starch synthase
MPKPQPSRTSSRTSRKQQPDTTTPDTQAAAAPTAESQPIAAPRDAIDAVSERLAKKPIAQKPAPRVAATREKAETKKREPSDLRDPMAPRLVKTSKPERVASIANSAKPEPSEKAETSAHAEKREDTERLAKTAKLGRVASIANSAKPEPSEKAETSANAGKRESAEKRGPLDRPVANIEQAKAPKAVTPPPVSHPAKPQVRRVAAPPKATRAAARAADYASSAPAAPIEPTSAPPPVMAAEPVEEAPTSTKRGKSSRPPAHVKQAKPVEGASKRRVPPAPAGEGPVANPMQAKTAKPAAAVSAAQTLVKKTTKLLEATPEAEVIETAPVSVPAPAPVVSEDTHVKDGPTSTPTPTSAATSTTTSAVVGATATPAHGAGGSLRVLMIASEAVPFAKTGGLADVAGALPAALGRLGHDVTLVLPRYRGVAVEGAPIATVDLLLGPDRLQADVYESSLGRGARAWLIDAPALYDREGLYNANGNDDHPDNPRRFAFLTRAAFEAARIVGFAPDIVHAHDWQGGLAPVYLKTTYANDRMLGGVPCIFTIHNIAYTGTFDPSWLPALDLGWDLFRPESIEYWNRISFLKAGINFGAKITTVSPTYAREILTPEFAYGFEGILAARRADLVGILNGIDADTWNPATDPHIPTPYSVDDLSGKRDAKRALLKAYGLPWDDDAIDEPLIGMVSRMIDQKGLDLIASVAHELPTLGARFVVLGTGEPRYEDMWRALSDRYPDRIAARIGFDEPLSHLVEAGADLFLMPSHYEPCGLNQMYSLRYGTLPLVRATGGLDDTVENYDPYTGRGNGFKFWEPSGPAMLNTLRWALRVYEHPDVWQRLQRAGMQLDFSWTRSAGEYARLYSQVLAVAGRPVRLSAG